MCNSEDLRADQQLYLISITLNFVHFSKAKNGTSFAYMKRTHNFKTIPIYEFVDGWNGQTVINKEFETLNNKSRIAPIMERLTRIFNAKFECDFKFRHLDELHPNERDLWCSNQNLNQTFSMHNDIQTSELDRVTLPIFIKKDLMGLLEANLPLGFDYNRIKNLTEMVSSLVETLYMTFYKTEELQLHEKVLLNLYDSGSVDNVIPLNRYLNGSGRFNIGSSSKSLRNHLKLTSNLTEKDFHGTQSHKKPCLIISSRAEDTQKMVLNLHENSRCYALINFWDLDVSIRHALKELTDLGNINLFIPNIVRLSDVEIFTLTQFLKLSPSADHPNILAGSTIPLNLLFDKKILPTELIKLLSQTYFHIEKPFSEYKRDGYVNHFLREYFS